MLVIILILIIAVVLLISIDRVSGRHARQIGRSVKAADDQLLNRFLYRRPQRPRPKP